MVMNSELILDKASDLYQCFAQALDKRMVFFSGLSGVGKSLYIQQFAKMAANSGRTVHLLQWDVTREAFQSEQILAKYPEVDGVTHSVIRKAVGLWARQGILQWHQRYADSRHILIAELPLIGNRLIELVQQHNDPVERLLASDQAQFFIPVPSESVRAHIIGCRTATIDKPEHAREAADAPVSVVNSMWQQVRELAEKQGMSVADKGYDPHLYAKVYQHLLVHRNAKSILIEQILPTQDSVYELEAIASELFATPTQAAEIFTQLESQYSLAQIEIMVNNWYQIQ